jgi:hypothetical protein
MLIVDQWFHFLGSRRQHSCPSIPVGICISNYRYHAWAAGWLAPETHLHILLHFLSGLDDTTHDVPHKSSVVCDTVVPVDRSELPTW